jgi:hypothetical protein
MVVSLDEWCLEPTDSGTAIARLTDPWRTGGHYADLRLWRATRDPGLVPSSGVVHDCLHADHALPLHADDVRVFVLLCLAAYILRTPRTIGAWAVSAPM